MEEVVKGFLESSDRNAIKKFIDGDIKKKSGCGLAPFYCALRKETDDSGRQSFRLGVFTQIVTSILKYSFEPSVDVSATALNDVLVELLADVSHLSASQCSSLCELIVDNIGCPMTLELLSSLLLHTSSIGGATEWRGARVSDFKTAIVQALIEKAPWDDKVVIDVAKFFRDIEVNPAQVALIKNDLSNYVDSLPGDLLLPFLRQVLPIHPLFLQEVLSRLKPERFDEATKAGLLSESMAAARQNPAIAKSIQVLIKKNARAVLSDAFKFRMCLCIGSIHRNLKTTAFNSLRNALILNGDYELKRYEARWLSETLPEFSAFRLVEASTISSSDDKVHLITDSLIDFGFLLLTTKNGGRIAGQGAQMLLTICQTSSLPSTVQIVLDQLLKILIQSPTKECVDLLAKMPYGNLSQNSGSDVLSALPSVEPHVSRLLVRVILQSCSQLRKELVISLRKALFRSLSSVRLVAANGLLEVIAYFTVDDNDISQNPNGRICLEALDLIRRTLLDTSPSSEEIQQCLLDGLPGLIKANTMLKESIFELLQEIYARNKSAHVVMAIANCICAYRKVHKHGTPKSRTLKDLFKMLTALISEGDSGCVDGLLHFATEFAQDYSNIVEHIKLNHSNDVNTSLDSTTTTTQKKKKQDKPKINECLLSNEVLCKLLRSETAQVAVRLHAVHALARRKKLESHERVQLLAALKDTLTKPYVDPETKRNCSSLLFTHLQQAVQEVFCSDNVEAARENLLKDMQLDSRRAFFDYFVELIRQTKEEPENEIEQSSLLACVQCICLLFPDDVSLISDIYSWAETNCEENMLSIAPLLLDLSSHVPGGLAIIDRMSKRLATLCGPLETSDEKDEQENTVFENLQTSDIHEVFALLNTVFKTMLTLAEWVITKVEISEEMEPRLIKQLYYALNSLAAIAQSHVPIDLTDGFFQTAGKAYKVLTLLAKYYSTNRSEISHRYPKLVHFVQKVCTPRFETLILVVEEESMKKNLGKKKVTANSRSQQAIPSFVFAVEQHHHELHKLSKKIELGDISSPAAARDFRINIEEVRKQQEDWSDEEIPCSQQIAPKKSKKTKKSPVEPPIRKRKAATKSSERTKVSWPPKKPKESQPSTPRASDQSTTELEETAIENIPSPPLCSTRISDNQENSTAERSTVTKRSRKRADAPSAAQPERKRRTLGLRRP